MYEEQNTGASELATPPTWGSNTPSPPSIAEPVLSSAYGASAPPDAPPAPGGASKLPWFAAVAGALVLLVGGGFFALTAFAASGGAATPEEAVDSLIAAANDEDFITLAELLEPSERRIVAEPMIAEILPELIRLGVLDESADAGDVEGFDWEFRDVTYRVETLAQNPDMVHVYFTGGQAAAEFNSVDFPFGDEFRERFGSDFEDEPRMTEDIEESGNPMVLVERDGRWYMSAMFTIAENARLEAGQRLPPRSEAPVALGSGSPEGAFEAMFAEMVEMDVEGLIGRMDPEELAVLYRYSPLFLDEAQDGLDELQRAMDESNLRWDINDFDFDVDSDGDDAVVTLRGFSVDVNSDNLDLSFTYSREQISGRVDAVDWGRASIEATPTHWVIEGVLDGEPLSVEVDIDPEARSISGMGEIEGTTFSGELALDADGMCSRYSVTASDGTQEQDCLEDQFFGGGDFIIQQYIGVFDDFASDFGGIPMAAHKTGGEWYVSPVSTMLNYYINYLKEIDEGEFEEMMDAMDVASAVGFGSINRFDQTGLFGDDAVVGENADSFGEVEELSSQEFEDLVAEFEEQLEDVEFDGPPALEPVKGDEFVVDPAPGTPLTLEGVLDEGVFDTVTIDLTAGEIVTITVEADPNSDLDTTVELFGPNGSVAYNDDALSEIGIGFLDSQIKTPISVDATYTIEVHSFADFATGAYTLTIERS